MDFTTSWQSIDFAFNASNSRYSRRRSVSLKTYLYSKGQYIRMTTQ